MGNSNVKSSGGASSAWSFTLRGNPYAEDSDTDSDSDNAVLETSDSTDLSASATKQPLSEESRLISDLDLSTREETVVYKPNPWSIAKINAVSRSSKPVVPNAQEKDSRKHFSGQNVSGRRSGPQSAKSGKPQQNILDSFTKQRERAESANSHGSYIVKASTAAPLKPATVPRRRHNRIEGENVPPLHSGDKKFKKLTATASTRCSDSNPSSHLTLPSFFPSAKLARVAAPDAVKNTKYHLKPSSISQTPAVSDDGPISSIPSTLAINGMVRDSEGPAAPIFSQGPGSSNYSTAFSKPATHDYLENSRPLFPSSQLDAINYAQNLVSPVAKPADEVVNPADNNTSQNLSPAAFHHFPPSFSSPPRPSNYIDHVAARACHSSPPSQAPGAALPPTLSRFRYGRPPPSTNGALMLRRYAGLVSPSKRRLPSVPAASSQLGPLQTHHFGQASLSKHYDRTPSPFAYSNATSSDSVLSHFKKSPSHPQSLYLYQAELGDAPFLKPLDMFAASIKPELPPSSPIPPSPPAQLEDVISIRNYSRSPSPSPKRPVGCGAKRPSSPYSSPRSSGRARVQSPSKPVPRRNAYEGEYNMDPDAAWSTLPSRKPASRKKVRQSGPVRLPLALRPQPNESSVTKTGMKADSERRVVTFLPTPLLPPSSSGKNAVEFGSTTQPENGLSLLQESMSCHASPMNSPLVGTQARHERGETECSPASDPSSGSDANPPTHTRRYTTDGGQDDICLGFDIADVGTRYPDTKRLMSE